jgi:hypothetical protein
MYMFARDMYFASAFTIFQLNVVTVPPVWFLLLLFFLHFIDIYFQVLSHIFIDIKLNNGNV